MDKLSEGITEREDELWQPHPANIPQQLAFTSEADELFYGGAAGGGKSELLLGLAATRHYNSIILRRVFPNLRSLIERSRDILNPSGVSHLEDNYNESLHRWRLARGGLIEFGAIQHEKDVRNLQGRPHDFYGWDEVTEFTESIFRFVNTWNRTTRPGQRCRIVATGNPPTTAAGEWVIQYWAAWLDPHHPDPAEPGELRWYVVDNGKDIEVPDGTPVEIHNEDRNEIELVTPRSRTFIPARVDDNPYLMATGYKATLQGLPEPLRTQMLYGDFTAGMQDNPWQVIPTAWVLDAQKRYELGVKPDVALRAVGVDVAHGGQDETVIARLYGNWFDELIAYPGEATPEGEHTAQYVLKAMESPAPVWIDSIGYGASAHERLKDHIKDVHGVNVGTASDEKDKSGMYGFANLRSEIYWRLREALDPENGENIALPNDRQLRADLCTPQYKVVAGKIKVEPKVDIIKRTGRSPDKGDAVVIVWHGANRPVQVARVHYQQRYN